MGFDGRYLLWSDGSSVALLGMWAKWFLPWVFTVKSVSSSVDFKVGTVVM